MLYKPRSDWLSQKEMLTAIALQTLQKRSHFWSKVPQLSDNPQQGYMLVLRTDSTSEEAHSTQWKQHEGISGAKHLNGSLGLDEDTSTNT